MYLKRLEIKGFKSFAEKIDLEFGKGITAIVGPNGSGKSNVSDAIRWVLGEQSAKTLRGAKMEDIIFAGTENRRPLGCAEVTLTLNNESNSLPIDYSEVTVTRRLYRSGESEYLINSSPCRLKDVVELFMDTGIGRDGYSLIGQGKIDEILSVKSEDRRNVFEEAAGIVKYKVRKTEAEKRLENTKQNLLRVNDIIEELEEQIEPLKEQSQVARRFLDLKEELKEIEINFLINSYEATCKKINKVLADIEALNLSKNEYETKKQQTIEEINRLKINAEELDTQYEINSNLRFEKEKQLENREGNIKLLKERQLNYSKDTERLKKEISENEELLKKVNTEIEKSVDESNLLKEKYNEQKCNIEAININYSDINKKYEEIEKSIENKKSDLIQILKNISDSNNKINSLNLMSESLEKRKAQLQREVIIKVEITDSLNLKIDNIQGLIGDLEKKLKELENKILEFSSLIDEYYERNNNLKSERNSIFDSLKTLEAKHSTLCDMEKDMEGFTRSVKSIISNFKDEQNVFGVIGDIVKVPAGYEIAMEIAMGSSIQNIVINNESTASHLIDYLKKNNLGRATFLPINTIRGKEIKLNEAIKSLKGFLGVASDVVETKKLFRNVVSFLLGRIIICDNLENAKKIAKAIDYSYRIVTLEGDVINAGGSFTGGSITKNSGIFSRKAQLSTLEAQILEKKQKFDEIEKNIVKFYNDIEKLKEVLNLYKTEKNNITLDLQSKALEHSGFNREREKIKEEKSDIETELTQIDLEVINCQKMLLENQNILNDMNIEQQNTEEQINKLQQSYKKYQTDKEEIWGELSSKRISMAEISKSLENINNIIEKEEDEKKNYLEKIQLFKSQIRDIDVNINTTNLEINNIYSEMNQIIEKVKNIREVIESIDINRKEVYLKINVNQKNLNTIDEETGSLIQSLHKLEINKSKLEMENESLANKLWDEYELTFLEAEKYRKPMEGLAVSSRRVYDLKNSIKELGDVNVNAIEEFKRVTERCNFLKGQREDLIKGENSLIEVIEEITKSMEKQFQEKFAIIKGNFNSTFKELFGGGYADLRIDGEDLLNSGIDIIVQPPGKKLQSLSLLSGGERGLAAIALVFAILKMKPTPFCVLDEIEASLDDANVNRFARFLAIYSKDSQFIVITHRKGSMAVADELYGVTMEEKGVSKVVSLKLKGGKKDGMAG